MQCIFRSQRTLAFKVSSASPRYSPGRISVITLGGRVRYNFRVPSGHRVTPWPLSSPSTSCSSTTCRTTLKTTQKLNIEKKSAEAELAWVKREDRYIDFIRTYLVDDKRHSSRVSPTGPSSTRRAAWVLHPPLLLTLVYPQLDLLATTRIEKALDL